MASLREARREIRRLLSGPDWQGQLQGIADRGSQAIGPLFSFLLLEPEMMHRAARALGLVIAAMHRQNPEAARNVVRRFMWHMNEESANIGWGIPCAFAETLAASPGLAAEYGRILNTYIMDLGFDDNYCDHDILRRDCYWAIGRLAQAGPEIAEAARPWLRKGLADSDSICRGMAAWALGQLKPDLMDGPALARLAQAGNEDICEIFEDGRLTAATVSSLAQQALAHDGRSGASGCE